MGAPKGAFSVKMKNLRTLTISELQSYAGAGNDEALKELGRRVVNMRIHEYHSDFYCRYKFELEGLQDALEIEIPLECPHCGGWLTDL